MPRKQLRRFASKGLWYCPTDIPPTAIKEGTLTFSDIASSPPITELPQ